MLKLSDNLIADGLDALEHAELQALQELDLSGNKVRTTARQISMVKRGALEGQNSPGDGANQYPHIQQPGQSTEQRAGLLPPHMWF